jgi:ATP-dependent RNA helicase RhlE
VLVATDIAARGIDVTALGHVVNFDVPLVPEDYIHRVGRTARAEATGSAFTLVAPEEEGSLRGIEKAINHRLPRVTLPDFDYTARAQAPPLDQRPPRIHSSRGPRGPHAAHAAPGGRGSRGPEPARGPQARRSWGPPRRRS